MSRQDQKDEFKEMEGNPAVKQRIRRLQRQAGAAACSRMWSGRRW
jgi:flagellar biosynthesis protein FlhB